MLDPEFRALIVEDDQAAGHLLASLLALTGVRADVARDGDEAISRFRSCRYGVIVLDLLLPHRNGFEVLREIRHFDPSLLERTIIVSGASERTLGDFDASSVRRIFRKPIEIPPFLQEVASCRPPPRAQGGRPASRGTAGSRGSTGIRG